MTSRHGLRTRFNWLPWLVLGAELVFTTCLLTALFLAMFVACLEGAA